MKSDAWRKDWSKYMATSAIPEIAKPSKVKEAKQARTRRARPLPGMARKLRELAAEIEETARLETERDRKDDGRVRAILNATSGGAIEVMLRSMNLSDPDREFLRDKGWRV
jgi:hypothetical protein